ncbi:MAG TPA: hypothetical protein VGR02_18430, partial [Thermoanaerobaculia bacterium]|nr:hypothetical protein [Thermoanaerobaculia bacterium]
DKLFHELRRGLEKEGVSKSEVAGLLDRGDQEIRFGILPEIPPPGPSQSAGDKGVRRREGRAR